MQPRLDYWKAEPKLMNAVAALNKAVEESGLSRPWPNTLGPTNWSSCQCSMINVWNRLCVGFRSVHPVIDAKAA